MPGAESQTRRSPHLSGRTHPEQRSRSRAAVTWNWGVGLGWHQAMALMPQTLTVLVNKQSILLNKCFSICCMPLGKLSKTLGYLVYIHTISPVKWSFPWEECELSSAHGHSQSPTQSVLSFGQAAGSRSAHARFSHQPKIYRDFIQRTWGSFLEFSLLRSKVCMSQTLASGSSSW